MVIPLLGREPARCHLVTREREGGAAAWAALNVGNFQQDPDPSTQPSGQATVMGVVEVGLLLVSGRPKKDSTAQMDGTKPYLLK